MQVRANISACRIQVLPQTETTLLGAAILAGLGCGVYADLSAAGGAFKNEDGVIVEPDTVIHTIYRKKFARWQNLLERLSLKAGSEKQFS